MVPERARSWGVGASHEPCSEILDNQQNLRNDNRIKQPLRVRCDATPDLALALEIPHVFHQRFDFIIRQFVRKSFHHHAILFLDAVLDRLGYLLIGE
jgi:hypothetical protein